MNQRQEDRAPRAPPGANPGSGGRNGRRGAGAASEVSGLPAPASLYPARTDPLETPMTTGMDDRKDAFEKKFAHDEELRFKATARRNKLLGLWAAGKLGKAGPDADA